jgi:hypothetical protein
MDVSIPFPVSPSFRQHTLESLLPSGVWDVARVLQTCERLLVPSPYASIALMENFWLSH